MFAAGDEVEELKTRRLILGTSFLMGDGRERRSDRREDDILWELFFSGNYTKCKFCIIEGSKMRGKRHIAQNA